MQRLKLLSLAAAVAGAICAQTPGPASVFGTGLASQLAVADTLPVSSYALPQLVFGGGWYTAIYFNNRTNNPKTANVFLFDANGQPLVSPALGSSSTALGLAGQGTTVVEFPDAGSLQQGWARVDIPDGVVGYGVFRLTIPGQPPQVSEGVIPFASTSTMLNSMIFDETAYVTGVAIANPSATVASVQITATGVSGQVIGTATQTLGPGARTAVVLRSVPGLENVSGQRGSLTFSTTTGALSVLGLRFNGLVFTSIPPFDQ